MDVQIILTELRRTVTFLPELILADLLFWNIFDRKRRFALRFLGFIILQAAVTLLLFIITEGTNMSSILGFVVALALSVLTGRYCFDISWLDAVFCATAGYSVQFTASTVSEFCQRVWAMPRWPFEIAVFIPVYTLLYLAFGRRLKKGQNLAIEKQLQFFLLIAAIATEIVICGILRTYWVIPENRTITICSMIPLILCSLGILMIQFSLLQGKELEGELEVMTHIMERERKQYQFNKEAIETINRKCHDMRHQIRAIGSTEKLSPEAIQEMTSAINIYDHLYKTGSAALDTILAERALYLQENKITLNVMADGKKLSFMRDTDIYSLFGNILENAITAVMALPPEKRDIYLNIIPKGEFLSIHQHNAFNGIVTIRDGLPQTQSTDTVNHGIGAKSIRYIVEKYGGTVSFVSKDNEFSVMILFNLSES